MPEIPGPPAQVLPEQARAAPQLPPMQPIAAAMLHPDPRTCQVLRHIGTLKLPFKVRHWVTLLTPCRDSFSVHLCASKCTNKMLW